MYIQFQIILLYITYEFNPKFYFVSNAIHSFYNVKFNNNPLNCKQLENMQFEIQIKLKTTNQSQTLVYNTFPSSQ